MFPGVDLGSCLALPTSQKARMDLVGMGEVVENEKDRLLNSVSVDLLSFVLPSRMLSVSGD